MAVPGEGCVADAEFVVEAECGEGVADLVEAFDDDGGDEVAGGEGELGGLAVGGEGEVFGVEGGEAVVGVEGFEGGFDDWVG